MQIETIAVPKVATREMLLAGAKHIERLAETDDDWAIGGKDEHYRAIGCAAAVWIDMIAALPPNAGNQRAEARRADDPLD